MHNETWNEKKALFLSETHFRFMLPKEFRSVIEEEEEEQEQEQEEEEEEKGVG